MTYRSNWFTSPYDYLERKEVCWLFALFLALVSPRDTCAIKLFFARKLYGKNSRQAQDCEKALIAYLPSDNESTIRTAIYRYALPKLRYFLRAVYEKGVSD